MDKVRDAIRHQREMRRQADPRSAVARIESLAADIEEQEMAKCQSLFTKHADANHRLKREKFELVMHEAFAASTYSVARLFDEFDHDFNGIDWREFTLVMKMFYSIDTDATAFLNFAFLLFDINENGKYVLDTEKKWAAMFPLNMSTYICATDAHACMLVALANL
jgi:Ca2+-binding EF-hand superfamily protein